MQVFTTSQQRSAATIPTVAAAPTTSTAVTTAAAAITAAATAAAAIAAAAASTEAIPTDSMNAANDTPIASASGTDCSCGSVGHVTDMTAAE